MAKNKIYIVVNGRKEGVFDNWNDCKEQIDKFPNAKYKSFKNEEAIRNDIEDVYADFYFKGVKRKTSNTIQIKKSNHLDSIKEPALFVDGACAGNPGTGEYRIVLKDEEVFLHSQKYLYTTNNIMEFLALVDAIEYNLNNNSKYFIYSDSITAISWVRNKKVKSTLKETDSNFDSFKKIEKALEFLKDLNFNDLKIEKWDTKSRGEIPADFGRK